MNMDTKLKIITYNCKHFVTTADKYIFMDELFLDCDCLASPGTLVIQE